MNTYTPPGLVCPGIFSEIPALVGLQTTRIGGISNEPYKSLNFGLNSGDDTDRVQANRQRLCRHLQIDEQCLVFSDQVHGTRVYHARQPGGVTGYDALITSTPGIFLCIFTADCYPILIHDCRTGASGAAHAGWKGTAGGIVAATLDAMSASFGTRPKDCHAWTGTGISGEYYEVGQEVAQHFEAAYLQASPSGNGRHLLDLAAANLDQLKAAGIPDKQVACSPYCTWKNNDLFYSWRREHGRTGRMLSLIGLTSRGPIA